MQKALFLVVFACIGALLVGWFYNFNHIQKQMESFVSAGPRFTAQDGQALCERVRALEERSYGFKDAGKMPLKCEYDKR